LLRNDDGGPRWAARVAPEKIRKLYETDARGMVDEELLDEVAFALYARCESILTVTEAVRGSIKCPCCSHLCGRIKMLTGKSDDVLRCGECGWEMTWGAYHRSFQKQHLIGRGAVPAFQAYVEQFPRARSPQEKMLLIDRLIHAIHKEYASTPQWPAAFNLIEGNVTTAVQLLDGLAYGPSSTPGTREVKADWYRIRERQAAGPKQRAHKVKQAPKVAQPSEPSSEPQQAELDATYS
jgi:hypothetical protein